MKLNNCELFDFFVEKEILALYHANTVSTSITYFQAGGLLSRGAVTNLGLFQTPQSSDALDIALGVWDDIFIDSTDLHSFFNRENHYGPVLFELDRNLILDKNFDIWITKNNPIYWNASTPLSDRYFSDVNELREKWHTIQKQRMMITIRKNTSPILFNYVRRVIVDDPKRMILMNGQNIPVFNMANSQIKNVITSGHTLSGKFIIRKCSNCWCTSNYLRQRNSSDIQRLFL